MHNLSDRLTPATYWSRIATLTVMIAGGLSAHILVRPAQIHPAATVVVSAAVGGAFVVTHWNNMNFYALKKHGTAFFMWSMVLASGVFLARNISIIADHTVKK